MKETTSISIKDIKKAAEMMRTDIARLTLKLENEQPGTEKYNSILKKLNSLKKPAEIYSNLYYAISEFEKYEDVHISEIRPIKRSLTTAL